MNKYGNKKSYHTTISVPKWPLTIRASYIIHVTLHRNNFNHFWCSWIAKSTGIWEASSWELAKVLRALLKRAVIHGLHICPMRRPHSPLKWHSFILPQGWRMVNAVQEIMPSDLRIKGFIIHCRFPLHFNGDAERMLKEGKITMAFLSLGQLERLSFALLKVKAINYQSVGHIFPHHTALHRYRVFLSGIQDFCAGSSGGLWHTVTSETPKAGAGPLSWWSGRSGARPPNVYLWWGTRCCRCCHLGTTPGWQHRAGSSMDVHSSLSLPVNCDDKIWLETHTRIGTKYTVSPWNTSGENHGVLWNTNMW